MLLPKEFPESNPRIVTVLPTKIMGSPPVNMPPMIFRTCFMIIRLNIISGIDYRSATWI